MFKHNHHTNQRTQLQLSIKHLLSAKDIKNDEFITSCLTAIGQQLYHGMYRILDVVIKNAKNDSLREMYEIVKDLKLMQEMEEHEHENENENGIVIDDNEESKQNENSKSNASSSSSLKKNVFRLLSKESIANICNFLGRRDINNFKVVSYDVGMVCLQHMNKYTFGICNTSKLIRFPSMYNSRYLNDQQLMNKEKYHSSTTIGNLYDIWQSIYNIPIKYQLPYRCVQRKGLNSHYHGFCLNNIDINTTVKQIEPAKRSLFLFDIRDIVIFTGDGETRIMNERDKQNYNNLEDYALVSLQYFDILKQRLMTIQYLLVYYSVTCDKIKDYVENNFISTCPAQREWEQKFKGDMSVFSSKLAVYGGRLKQSQQPNNGRYRRIGGRVPFKNEYTYNAEYFVSKIPSNYPIAQNGRRYQRSLILQISSKKSKSLYEEWKL